MPKPALFSLKFQVFAALSLFVFFTAAFVFFMISAMKENQTNNELLNTLRQLEVSSEAIFRHSDHYLANAPRSYPNYYRDVALFYPNFMQDLSNFDQLVTNLSQAYAQIQANSLLKSVGIRLQNADLDTAVNTTTNTWQTFFTGLKEQLGDDQAEPRLEWGTEFIKTEQGKLREQVTQLINDLNLALKTQVETISATYQKGLILLAFLVALGVFWFYWGVTRRITHTVRGCERISTGDFGYQVPIDRLDELGNLRHAVNHLSARAKFVLASLSEIQYANSPAQALQSLWQESEGYLNADWMGLYEVAKGQEQADLINDLPDYWQSEITQINLVRQTRLRDLIRKGEALRIENLGEYVVKNPDVRTLRQLATGTDRFGSLLILPLLSETGWQGLLILARHHSQGFNQDQTDLMQNLAPLIAKGFAKAKTQAA